MWVIKKAVFPVGGLGTRVLLPTKAIPKEMLPVVDKPLIQYAVEEAYAAGVRQMIFLTGGCKRVIGDRLLLLTGGIVALFGREKVQAFWYGGVRRDNDGKKRFLLAAKHEALANPELPVSVLDNLQRMKE
jgi:UTP-glucose-1-phosphate uridylyltransferase